jgi:adenylosuccinate synthase
MPQTDGRTVAPGRLTNGAAVGTTRRGIGPANVSKVNRIGIRVGDLSDWSVVTSRVTIHSVADHLGVEVGAVTKGPRDSDMLVRLGSDLARAYAP